jgi:deferrochelatase/peroxidase EfeB
VGRWPSGAPLVRAPEGDDAAHARDNTFVYDNDPTGQRCPLGAHIRRANPRDSLEPGPEESAVLTRRHMIMRRGRPYGPPIAPFQKEPTPQERGLFFIAVNANLGRQFEFMQQTWLNNPKFDGLYDETDPLTGPRDPKLGGSFSIPDVPARRRLHGLPAFVTTHGGGYFFLPGLPALRYLARLPAP